MKTVLVVDDEPMILSIIETYVKHKYNVLSFNNTSDLLIHYKNHGADGVISDFYMPDLTGQELCLKIKEIKPCPVILISGSILELDKMSMAVDFIKKPFSPTTLLKLLDEKIGVENETK